MLCLLSQIYLGDCSQYFFPDFLLLPANAATSSRTNTCRLCIALAWLYSVTCLSDFNVWFKATVILSFIQPPFVSIAKFSSCLCGGVPISLHFVHTLHGLCILPGTLQQADSLRSQFSLRLLCSLNILNWVKRKRNQEIMYANLFVRMFHLQKFQEFRLHLLLTDTAYMKTC